MERYADIVESLLKWAEPNADIRCILVLGSQARTEVPADVWSDMDAAILTREPEALLRDSRWIAHFGRVVCTFTEGTGVGAWKERRVLYADNRDVDFAILPADGLQSPDALRVVAAVLARGYKILIDRDDFQSIIGEMQVQPAAPRRPTALEIENEINDFYYHITWILKKIARGELWTATSCINNHLSRLLLDMITWKVITGQGSKIDTWHNGRYLERWAPRWAQERLRSCFATYSAEAALEALASAQTLYRELAADVAQHVGWRFPQELDQSIRDLSRTIAAERQ